MDLQSCIDFATKQYVAYFATVEGDQPRVRPLGLWFANENGFYFQAWFNISVCQQLQQNNRAELCFYEPKPDGSTGKVMRVTGRVEFLDDIELKNRAIKDKPYLEKMGLEGPEDPRLAIFRVCKGESYFWTVEFSGREAEIERVPF